MATTTFTIFDKCDSHDTITGVVGGDLKASIEGNATITAVNSQNGTEATLPASTSKAQVKVDYNCSEEGGKIKIKLEYINKFGSKNSADTGNSLDCGNPNCNDEAISSVEKTKGIPGTYTWPALAGSGGFETKSSTGWAATIDYKYEYCNTQLESQRKGIDIVVSENFEAKCNGGTISDIKPSSNNENTSERQGYIDVYCKGRTKSGKDSQFYIETIPLKQNRAYKVSVQVNKPGVTKVTVNGKNYTSDGYFWVNYDDTVTWTSEPSSGYEMTGNSQWKNQSGSYAIHQDVVISPEATAVKYYKVTVNASNDGIKSISFSTTGVNETINHPNSKEFTVREGQAVSWSTTLQDGYE